MKRKYGGQRRSARKRFKRTTRRSGARGISSTGMLARRAGTYKGSKSLRRLAQKISKINSAVFPTSQDIPIIQSTSTTAAKYLIFPIEYNPMDILSGLQGYNTNVHKWSQNVRWNLWLEGMGLPQRIEVLILRNKKSFANPTTAISDEGANLANMSRSFCYNAGLRSDFSIVKTFSFCGNNNGTHKGLSGFCKIPRRTTEDWRDATDVAQYFPKNSYFILLRHCNMSDNTSHDAIRGTFSTTNFTYSSTFS